MAPATGPRHRLTHHEDDFVVLEFLWRRERDKKSYQKPERPLGSVVSPGVPDPGQASLRMEGTESKGLVQGRWRATTACPPCPHHLSRPWLSTKTQWCCGHGAGIPLLLATLETVAGHSSTMGRDGHIHPCSQVVTQWGAWHGHLPTAPDLHHWSMDLVAQNHPCALPAPRSRAPPPAGPGHGAGRCQGEAGLKIKARWSGDTFPSPDYSRMELQLLRHPALPGAGDRAKWLAGTY